MRWTLSLGQDRGQPLLSLRNSKIVADKETLRQEHQDILSESGDFAII
jgi:hypothetical protein